MRTTNKFWWMLMLLVLGMLGAGNARADLVSTTPYSLSISESQAVLAHPGNDLVADMAALTTGHELAIERSEPYFLLTNTSTASQNGSIVQFQMSIGDTADHFRFVELIGSASTAGVQLVSSSLGTANQELTLDFSGLPVGASVEFRVGLAPNSSDVDPLVDYAHVLFNNGSAGVGNAVTTVTFGNTVPTSTTTDGNSPSSVSGSGLTTTTTLADQAAIAAASALTTSSACNCGNEGVGVQAFDFGPTIGGTGTSGAGTGGTGTGSGGTGGSGDSGGSPPVLTPEPSSVVLLGLGLLGLVSVAWRKRRSA